MNFEKFYSTLIQADYLLVSIGYDAKWKKMNTFLCDKMGGNLCDAHAGLITFESSCPVGK